MPRIDGRGRGVLHAVVEVTIPKALTDRARALFTELEAELKGGESKGGSAPSEPTSGKKAQSA